MKNKALLLKAHSWLVDWAEKQGFNQIEVDCSYYPSEQVAITVYSNDIGGRLSVTGVELLRAGEEWEKLLSLKTEATLLSMKRHSENQSNGSSI